ncbi:MAG TPA: hypothetical protein VNR60_12120 [Croceibacterium sp.]|nr:hypothetical protein [Croceibacterium sp.]
MRIPAIAAAALAMTATSAIAAESTENAEEKSEKKICRTERMTGSLTRSTRICLTEAQWREVNDRTRRGLDEMGRSAAGGTAVQNNRGAGG